MTNHRGRVAVVTGAARGLGQAVARRLAASGATVACADVDGVAARKTAEEIGADGGRAAGFEVDVTSEASLAALREQVHAVLGRVDMVMNVAGILDRRQMADTDGEAFRRVIDVNLTGTYLTTRAFAADMTERGWGRVVNTASIAGVTGYVYPSYAASKAGVVNLTRSLLVDFWGTGVTVNAVRPGAMDTEMLDRSAIPAFIRKTPAGRVVTPQEVAAVFDFLAGEEAACVNGATIVVDGGATAVFRYADPEPRG